MQTPKKTENLDFRGIENSIDLACYPKEWSNGNEGKLYNINQLKTKVQNGGNDSLNGVNQGLGTVTAKDWRNTINNGEKWKARDVIGGD